jgi:hypothetical protein
MYIKSTTLNNMQIDHIWINTLTTYKQYHVGDHHKAYWTNHNPIYIYILHSKLPKLYSSIYFTIRSSNNKLKIKLNYR